MASFSLIAERTGHAGQDAFGCQISTRFEPFAGCADCGFTVFFMATRARAHGAMDRRAVAALGRKQHSGCRGLGHLGVVSAVLGDDENPVFRLDRLYLAAQYRVDVIGCRWPALVLLHAAGAGRAPEVRSTRVDGEGTAVHLWWAGTGQYVLELGQRGGVLDRL